MKPTPLALLATLATTALVHAQDKTTADFPASPTTARILGEIPDGTPPPPFESKPPSVRRLKNLDHCVYPARIPAKLSHGEMTAPGQTDKSLFLIH